MKKFDCPYLNDVVELTDEREFHIAKRHPDLLPKYKNQLEMTLKYPDEVRRSERFSIVKLLFYYKRLSILNYSSLKYENRQNTPRPRQRRQSFTKIDLRTDSPLFQ